MRIALSVLALICIPQFASAQEISIALGEGGSLSARVVQIFIAMTVLSLAPGIAIMVTCFPFLITVFSILRQALGLQQSPPNMLIVSLALFLTYFIMEPVFTDAWHAGVAPFLYEEIQVEEAFGKAVEPFRTFMAARVDPETLASIHSLRPVAENGNIAADQVSLSVLIPSFMLSEIARAFQIGFLIFLPFLIIDLVVAAILMSMGMMMVPPVMVALPFKLVFFVVADGWTLLSEALVRGYFN
ncbi:MAG: flagellar type III secretion system pore protein FliP [Paracoccaceae bacterium]